MSYPPNTPLGRLGVETLDENPRRCVASIPVGGLVNPLTGAPTIAPMAMLVDHVGGLVNHYRREPGEWTVSSELALELTPDATALIAAAPQIPVVATGRPFGTRGAAALGLCELTHGGELVATATVRSFYVRAPEDIAEWRPAPSAAAPPAGLAEKLAVRVAESGGSAMVLQQLPDPVLNNLIGIVHGGVSSAALELVASAAVNDGRADPLHTASLRVNFLRPFQGGTESRYEGTALRVGRSSGVGEARAVGDDGEVAIIARLTAYSR
ncbi:PaaI family thioesterase [Mycobacterium hubeiense]|uniref:PaaI family thioesterase n=1 Tax=Mycobacterium hubeiense TaxID=1867256 RepID=UPI000C7EF547|nr:PaaI family thioesterase [Mycobacterium sp. QGD 101]